MAVSNFSASGPEARDAFNDDARPDAGASEPARKVSGERNWRHLLELDAELYEQSKLRLLTPEARVLINLKLNGSMPVTAAMQLAGVSYRGFYAVLERLKQAGLVRQVKDLDDQRVRNLRLDPSTPMPPDNF